MYKNYNFQPKSLSPKKNSRFFLLAEKLLPFLLIITSFIWLWK